jgi:hypothetical protein
MTLAGNRPLVEPVAVVAVEVAVVPVAVEVVAVLVEVVAVLVALVMEVVPVIEVSVLPPPHPIIRAASAVTATPVNSPTESFFLGV